MFEYIRKNSKILTVFMMLLVVPSFIFGGLELYQSMSRPTGDSVATVGAENITQQEWDYAHRQQLANLRQQNPNIDAALLESDYVKYSTLERLLEQRLLTVAVQEYKLYPSDATVAQAIAAIPEVAALRDKDGNIDAQKYAELLKANGHTTASFEAGIRQQLGQEQLVQGMATTNGWQPSVLTQQNILPLLERREIQVAMFETKQYADQVKPTDAQLQTWYKDNASKLYSKPEQVDVEYVLLDADAITKRHPYGDTELRQWYGANAAQYGAPETRRARHILITADKNKADAAQLEAAKKKAQSLLEQLKQKPESFAELAKKHSQDPGSATKGGDLGFFDQSTMVKPFADAAFALKKGEISDVVQSQFGFHIIQLDAIKPSTAPSFDEIKDKITPDFRQQWVAKHFNTEAEKLVKAVEQSPSDLQTAAKSLDLTVHTAQELSNPPSSVNTKTPPVLMQPQVLQALFTTDATSKKQAIKPISLDAQTVFIGRVLAHKPAHVEPFDVVKAQVQADYTNQEAAKLAQAAGKKALAQWQANPKQAKLDTAAVVSRIQPGVYPHDVVEAALLAPTKKLPAWQGVDVADLGYAVIRVNKALEPDAEMAAIQTQQVPMVTQALYQAQMRAYLDALRTQFKATIKVPKPATPKELQGIG